MTERAVGPSESEFLGGFDERYAKVMRVFVAGDVAVALVDSNGDGEQVMAEPWERVSGVWVSTGFSTSFGSGVAGRMGEVVWVAGHASPSVVVRVAFRDAAHEVVADDHGLWGWVGQDSVIDTELPQPL